jgi:hypothetical protein
MGAELARGRTFHQTGKSTRNSSLKASSPETVEHSDTKDPNAPRLSNSFSPVNRAFPEKSAKQPPCNSNPRALAGFLKEMLK